MQLQDATVLVTGANRGIGAAFARECLARGARKVYAGARNPASVTQPGVEAVQLDVNNAADVAAAAQRMGDVTVLINNAGIAHRGGFLAEGAIDAAKAQLDTNYFGTWRMSAAFAPVLARHGGGAIVNVLSVATWTSSPLLAVYGSSKAAAWSLTNGLRNELRGQGTQVLAMHMGYVDTDLIRDIVTAKSTPEAVVGVTLDALERGDEEVLADAIARMVKAGLGAPRAMYLQ